MVELTVDGNKVEVPEGSMVMHAAQKIGLYVPHFCYHKKLSIAANCRMCLVEVEKAPKALPACATPVTNGMVVHTCSEKARAAQKSVMEFLLINHPLDCPICDQGGECQLQDLAVGYGGSSSRYTEEKRVVFHKDLGPLVSAEEMSRCIHCTRCVRFSEEVAGVDEIGALYRGEDMQITTYLEHAAKHELSANVIDLCPVGALTSRPYAYEARPWELSKTLSIDVSDAMGANIRVDSRGGAVLRVLPRINDDVNEEWISDKARYQVDGLALRRLDKVWLRKKGRLQQASWDEAFTAIAKAKAGSSVAAVAGDLVDCETMFAAKALLAALGSDLLESRQTGMSYPTDSLALVNFNSTFAGIEEADAILIVGSHVRWEAPLLNARLRKAVKRGAKVFIVGPHWETTFPAEFLGEDAGVLHKLPGHVGEVMSKAERPAVIVGGGGLVAGALHPALALAQAWNAGFNVLHFSAARMGALMLGFAQKGGIADLVNAKPKLLLSLGADEVDYSAFGDALKVYIGHHGDKGAHAADVILPASAYTEKPGTYVNTEGRVQLADKAVFAPGDAREDWTILRALADALGVNVGFDSFTELRAAMAAAVPALGREGLADYGPLPKADAKAKAAGAIVYPIKDFYLTNPIARASHTMQRCSAELLHGEDFAEAAE